MSDDGCIVVVGGTDGIGKELARYYAGTGRETVLTGRDAARAEAVAAEIGGSARGIALDLARPKTIRDGLASVGPVKYLAIVAIQRDDNTIRDFDIDRALELVTLKLVGFAEVVHVLLDRLSPDSSIVLFGGQAKDRPYPGSTTVSTVNGGIAGLDPDARLGARPDPGQRHPSRDHRRQPVLARQAAGHPRGPHLEDHHQETRDDGRHRRRHAVPAREPVRRGHRPRRRQRPADVLSIRMRTASLTGPSATRTGRPDYPEMGERLREARRARNLSLRTLAERLGVSPSLISQIETGRANPSVSTLYAIAAELDVSLDELLFNDRRPAEPATPVPARRERRPAGRWRRARPSSAPPTGTAIRLASGVLWERLTTLSEPGVEFLHVTYEVGGASSPPDAFQRHPGHEWGYVLSGRLQVRIGFDEYVLEPGDAISINSSIPHRLATLGDEPVHAIWFVLGRAQFDAQTLIDDHLAGRD